MLHSPVAIWFSPLCSIFIPLALAWGLYNMTDVNIKKYLYRLFHEDLILKYDLDENDYIILTAITRPEGLAIYQNYGLVISDGGINHLGFENHRIFYYEDIYDRFQHKALIRGDAPNVDDESLNNDDIIDICMNSTRDGCRIDSKIIEKHPITLWRHGFKIGNYLIQQEYSYEILEIWSVNKISGLAQKCLYHRDEKLLHEVGSKLCGHKTCSTYNMNDSIYQES